ncbi:MAG: redoxin domain-containing protein, partial [Acidobacteria bacterium]|nr:redoxin domain-containing protein [Acidobacteriota bacterium]
MKSIRTTFSALLVAIAACGAPQDEVSVAIGSPAPSFELEDLDGSAVASSTYSGRPALLNFWATWCQ